MHFFTKPSLNNPLSRAKPSRYAGFYGVTSRGAVEGYGRLDRQVGGASFCVSKQRRNSLAAQVENAGRGENSTLLGRLIPSTIRTISLDCGSGGLGSKLTLAVRLRSR